VAILTVTEGVRRTLEELAAEANESVDAILSKALAEYRRKRYYDKLNAQFAALRADPEAWREELEERAAWDATLGDGISENGGGIET